MRHLLAAALLAVPVSVAAQDPARTGPGPLVVERLENRFIVAPDFKITEIDGDTGHLAVGYAGWRAEDTLLVGGAAYWLANEADDAEMAYGGLLVGWNTPAERRIQFGARGLVEVGRATLGTDVTRFARFGSRRPDLGTQVPSTAVRVRGRDDFFVRRRPDSRSVGQRGAAVDAVERGSFACALRAAARQDARCTAASFPCGAEAAKPRRRTS